MVSVLPSPLPFPHPLALPSPHPDPQLFILPVESAAIGFAAVGLPIAALAGSAGIGLIISSKLMIFLIFDIFMKIIYDQKSLH